MSLQASGNLGSDNRSIGLFVGLSAGVFSRRGLDTPAFSTSSSGRFERVFTRGCALDSEARSRIEGAP